MAALLVSLAVMSVLMGALLPAWRHQAQREKEAELVFRGEQYVRAIRLWEMKMGPGSRPPNFDILVQQKYPPEKIQGPDDRGRRVPAAVRRREPAGAWRPRCRVDAGRAAPVRPGRARQCRPRLNSRRSLNSLRVSADWAGGGILGVASKSKESSILIYKGRSHYNEWTFVYANASSAPGGAGSQMPGGRGGSPFPGGRGLPGGRGPGGRGVQPGGERGFGPGGRGMGGSQGPVVTPGVVPPGRGR